MALILHVMGSVMIWCGLRLETIHLNMKNISLRNSNRLFKIWNVIVVGTKPSIQRVAPGASLGTTGLGLGHLTFFCRGVNGPREFGVCLDGFGSDHHIGAVLGCFQGDGFADSPASPSDKEGASRQLSVI